MADKMLNTNSLPEGYRLVSKLPNLGFDGQELFVIVSENILYLISKKPALIPDMADEPGFDVYQSEYPLSSVSWFVDVVENSIWRSSAEGGLPAGKYHVVDRFGGEELKVSRDMNCGARYQKGISWKNLSRKPTGSTFGYQEKQLTDQVLREGGLLNILRSIS
ncbi:hypothetical protein M0G74_09900 [Microbulbifer sp. CAU 1566]|uniref:hypothetical protein n=1 Tax=Microbulbifer sp. CAU 1566 TaxID=2933269 RepID=UPI0020052FBE|nr:hypothetical protein [Microbulbifer sp. CAU 1566]MCK7597578.1 hypothetical protein [Microbulbifer sp. CAU 1566]